MEEVQLGSSSQILMGFPRYRRSHLRSQTYSTLVRILSHSFDHSHLSASTQLPDNNDTGRTGQENQEKESESSEVVGSDFVQSMDSVYQKETEVHETNETIEDGGAQERDFSANKMMVLDDIELLMGTEEVVDSSRRTVDVISTQTNGSNKEQRLMDELELIVKGTENSLVRDSGLIVPLNSGSDEKHNESSEVELIDYQVQHVEFRHSDANESGNASELQVQGELNQHASEGFHSSLMVNTSASMKGQTSVSTISTSGVEHERQQEEMELVKSDCAAMGSLPTTKEGEFEKEEQCSQEVAEAMHFSLDHDMNDEALALCVDGGLLDAIISEDKHEMGDEGEKSGISICTNDATTSSSHLIEKGDIEEGEISGELEIDGSSFDMSSEDDLILQQKEVGEVQKPKNIIENIELPCNIWNGQKKEDSEYNSFVVNALQNTNNYRKVEPRAGDKNGIAYGDEVAISLEAIKCYKEDGFGSVLKPGNNKDQNTGNKGATGLPTALAQNQVLHRGLLEENGTKDHENSSAGKQKVDVSKKKKRGPVSEEKKAKKKIKKRKKRAEKNRQLGVKRLKLPPIQKPKTIAYCRHYLKGRCNEGDKCQFSHDTVPLTKSKPCCHFARHSCMKGDDCPFDHQLSKYPCTNFVSKGSCIRGDACMFSHQVPTKQDTPMPSNVSGPELKPPLVSGNSELSMPLNNRVCSYFQKNHISNSTGIHSHTNTEHEVTNTAQKKPAPVPKGISFLNVGKSSLLSPGKEKQGTVTPNKESLVQIGTRADKSPSGAAQNLELPKKLPAVAPKGINFLSFGKGPASSFKSPVSSFLNRENGIKLPQLDNFGLPELPSSSLNKDYYSKVGDGTKQSVLQTALFSNETSQKNQSVAEGINLNFPGKAPLSTADLQVSLNSHEDQSHSKSVQEGVKASDNSQTSASTSSMLSFSPFVSRQSSELLASRYYKGASKSGHRALLSTLAFAAEHESDIKMKCSSGTSTV